jgi:predicted metal-dependent hydrolase
LDNQLIYKDFLPELGLAFTLTRKPIKRAYLRVRPPDGEITVNAPFHLPMGQIYALIRQHHDWIIKNQNRLAAQPKPSPDSTIQNGQTVHVLGQSHTLSIQTHTPHNRTVCQAGVLHILSRTELNQDQIRARISAHLRDQLAQVLQERLPFWSAQMGVTANFIGIKHMKTRWGSCNIRDARIWINLALARMPPGCIDLVLVHELTHLLERGHNARFYGFMDQFLPEWRRQQAELKNWGMHGL